MSIDLPDFFPRKVWVDSGSASTPDPGDRVMVFRADSLGIVPYIPFEINSISPAKGSPMRKRKFHEFQLLRDMFDVAYHQRSNVEATFSAIKRKLGEPLLSKTSFARFNELLAKILAYNVGVAITQAHLHGLEPSPIDFIPRALPTKQVAGAAA